MTIAPYGLGQMELCLERQSGLNWQRVIEQNIFLEVSFCTTGKDQAVTVFNP